MLRAEASRLRSLTLVPGQPAITLIARPLPEPTRQLPLMAPPWVGAAGDAGATGNGDALPGVWVSEAMVALYQATPGTTLRLPLAATAGVEVRVLGVWRDYARQFGTVVMDAATYQALTGDVRSNDLALWLRPGADVDALQTALRALADSTAGGSGAGALMEFAVPADIRAQSLRIFDRSFAVTRYLQVLAIAIGLFGIAASFSAQVLARRREFGLLAHLGFTRRQVLVMVAAEGAAWTAAGALLGVLLGLAVAAVLVYVVNPQSFHWSMDLVVPWARLLGLCAAVLLAASVAAGLSARSAVSVHAVRAVKEDW